MILTKRGEENHIQYLIKWKGSQWKIVHGNLHPTVAELKADSRHDSRRVRQQI
jgi:hypothetical protein